MKPMLAAALTLGLLVPATAGHAVPSLQSYKPSQFYASESWTFAAFDQSLGTLESYDIRIAGKYKATYSVTNRSGSVGLYSNDIEYNVGANFRFNGVHLGTASDSNGGSLNKPDQSAAFIEHAVNLELAYSGDYGLAEFLKADGVTYAYSLRSDFTYVYSWDNNDLRFRMDSFTFTPDFDLTYYYQPAAVAVPEPSTWAMMLVGFGLAGGAVRSRRRAQTLSPA